VKAQLILEDGALFEGEGFGSDRDAVCDFIFNTSMTGYLELLSDPSNLGRGIVMTFPLIGNYGICKADAEADRPSAEAFIMRESAPLHSNFRSEGSLAGYMEEHGIPGLAGVDTRALMRHMRTHGEMRGLLTRSLIDTNEAKQRIVSARPIENPVAQVTCKAPYTLGEGKGQVIAALDLGLKRSAAEAFTGRGRALKVWPATSKAAAMLEDKPGGIFISDGPGDPGQSGELLPEIKALTESGLPVFATGLGCLLAAQAAGFEVYRLALGHRGSNYPVREGKTGKTFITAQNHGWAVRTEGAAQSVTHTNVNDGTVEGLSLNGGRVQGVLFTPEPSAQPTDGGHLYDEFLAKIGGRA